MWHCIFLFIRGWRPGLLPASWVRLLWTADMRAMTFMWSCACISFEYISGWNGWDTQLHCLVSFRNCQNFSQRDCDVMCPHQQCIKVPNSSRPQWRLLPPSFLTSWSQRVKSGVCPWFWSVLHWQLMTLRIFSCVSGPFVYLLCRKAYTDPLPIFKSSYLSFIIKCQRFYTFYV